MKSVAIIGGGITGLTAAFRLRQKNLPVVLYEASQRVGGVIETVRQDGYLAEFGPNSILETSPIIGALVRDLDLEPRRLYSEPRAENRYIVRGGKPVRLPGSPLGFLFTPLFSPAAKLRLLGEPFIRRAPDDREESLAEFVIRRIGTEFLEYAINPFVAGVYAGDPHRLSVQHAFPKLYALEQKYGSLIRGQVLGARERRRRAEVSKDKAKKLSFDQGLQVLTDTLRDHLADGLRLQSPVARIEQLPNGWRIAVRPQGREESHDHAAVVYAGPAYRLPELRLSVDQAPDWSPLAQIQYPPVASVVLGFRRQDVAHPLDGFGMLIPEVERFSLLGTLFSSSLFPNRAPEGHVALTSYLGGMRDPGLALLEREKLVELTLRDLRTILGISGRPTFQHATLFPKAIPQYEVGYGRFKELMNQVEAKGPGLFLAGNYRFGISLGDSIVSGHHVADKVADFLTTTLRGEQALTTELSTTATA